MHHFFTTLRFRLILLVFLAILPALGLILYAGLEHRRLAANEARKDVLDMVHHASAYQERVVEGARQMLSTLSELPMVQRQDGPACTALFARILGKQKFYANISAINLQGIPFASALPQPPKSQLGRSHFERALQSKEFSIGEYGIGRASGKPTLHFGYPIIDNGEVTGVVSTSVILDYLGTLVAKTPMPPDAMITVIDRDGTVLARHPQPEKWLGKRLPETEIIKIVVARGEGITEAVGLDGALCIFAFAPLGVGGQDLFVYAGEPIKTVYAEANRILVRNLLAMGGVGVLALIMAWILGQIFLVGRTHLLVNKAQQMASGDLAVRSELSYEDGEFGQLAKSFDEMATALRQRELNLKESEEKYRNLIENINLGITMIGSDFRIQIMNEGQAQLFNRKAAEFTGKFCFQEFEKRDRVCPHCPGVRAMATGQPAEVETEGVRDDGTRIPAHIYAFPTFAPDGQVSGFVEVVEDISERRKVQEQLAWGAQVNSAMVELSRALLASRSIEDISQMVLDSAVALTNSAVGYCGYLEAQTGYFVVPTLSREVWEACQVPGKNIIFKEFNGLWGYGLKHRQPVLSNNPAADPNSSGTPQGHIPIHNFVAVPAMLGEHLLGQVAVANAPRDYTARDQEVCERLALFYALAIQRQRAEEALRESEQRFRDITENAAEWVWEVDCEGRYTYCSPAVEKLLGYKPEEVLGKHFYDFFLPEDREALKDASLGTFEDKKPFRDFLNCNVSKNGGLVWLSSSGVAVLDAAGNLLGYRGSDIDITEGRAAQEALENANIQLRALVQETEERNSTMALLNDMSEMLQTCQTSEEAFAAIRHFVPQFFPGDAGALYLLRNSKNLLSSVTTWGPSPPTEEMFPPDDCWAVRSGRVHRVDDPASALLCKHIETTGVLPTAHLCVPLVAQSVSLGILHVQVRSCATREREADDLKARQRLAVAVAENLALSLANIKLRETLQNQAIRDPLTGLYNRRYLEETMDREIHRARRLKTPLGVVMMDLDRFKDFNDAFGHAAGDALLSALAHVITGGIRTEDIACRYGGEEFLLVLPGASLETTRERAENVRQAVKALQVKYQGRFLRSTTISLGIAIFPDQGHTAEEVIAAADAALYQAKQAGRDRVEIATPHSPSASAP